MYIVYLIVYGCILTAVLGLVASWIDRKVTARIQYRKGPLFFQPWIDIVKLLGKETIIPAIEGRARDSEFLQRAPRRQVRLLHQADDLLLLGCGVSHSSSPPSAIMLF